MNRDRHTHRHAHRHTQSQRLTASVSEATGPQGCLPVISYKSSEAALLRAALCLLFVLFCWIFETGLLLGFARPPRPRSPLPSSANPAPGLHQGAAARRSAAGGEGEKPCRTARPTKRKDFVSQKALRRLRRTLLSPREAVVVPGSSLPVPVPARPGPVRWEAGRAAHAPGPENPAPASAG